MKNEEILSSVIFPFFLLSFLFRSFSNLQCGE